MATNTYVPHTVWVKYPYDHSALEGLPARDKVLKFILNCGPCCAPHIMTRTGLGKSTVSNAIRKLENEQLVRSEIRQVAYQNRRLNFYSGIK